MKIIRTESIPFSVDEDGYERLAFAEVVIPNTPNVYGDLHSKESVRQFAYGFMINGFGLDINHDNNNVSYGVRVVESFIARDDDPDYVAGAWVVGIHVLDDSIWADILSGELNGYSYEALVSILPVDIVVPGVRNLIGVTLPDPDDAHTHNFWVRLDANGRVIAGGTTMDHGHDHPIRNHTFTEHNEAGNHRHRYSVHEDL